MTTIAELNTELNLLDQVTDAVRKRRTLDGIARTMGLNLVRRIAVYRITNQQRAETLCCYRQRSAT